jgi:energy-coupling factor transporter ATP-binding protein EcfA2
MNRKLAVATCLMGRAELIILDEPTAGLDPASADALAVLIEELRTGGKLTFVVAGHDMRFMARAAKEVLWLKEGRVRMGGRAAGMAALPAYRAVKLSLRDSRGLRERLAAAGAGFKPEEGALSVRLDPSAEGALMAELLASGDLLSVAGGGDLEEAFREVSSDTAQG